MTQPGATTTLLNSQDLHSTDSMMINPTDVESIEIYIQSPDNRMISFNLESTDTIEYLKSLISDKTKISTDKQILYFDEQKLDNSGTISSYDISTQSALTLEVIKTTQMYVL